MNLHGKNIIGYTLHASGKNVQVAYNPATLETLSGQFTEATENELNEATRLAKQAFKPFSSLPQKKRAQFLKQIADEILRLGDALIHRVMEETALPEARVIGERGRTMGQLIAFESLLEDGSWVEATIDTADPKREPLPKPDIRKYLTSIGPVAVFAASNFPLAFSVAGGDTASALAAGCPVIVKAHSGHLGTSELIATAIAEAARKTEMPDGVFSLLYGSGATLGQQLVQHPEIKAVGFTGSYNAGKTLFDIAAKRDEPIPVYAEMGSINPVVVFSDYLSSHTEELTTTLAGSITLGTGQFCTNPGLIISEDSENLSQFVSTLATKIKQIQPSTMLNKNVFKGYQQAFQTVSTELEVNLEGKSETIANVDKLQAEPCVMSVSGSSFLNNPNLHKEVFGPFSLIVKCKDKNELNQVVSAIEGQLTASFWGTENELELYAETVHLLQDRCGRIIYNNVPTGVEVCASMHHGGPFPASTNGMYTSVGTDAVKRFVRPLSFQNYPKQLLPDELKDENPLNIMRKVNNQFSNKNI